MIDKKTEVPGITFTGSITVNGPMFDIHDNENVHIHTNGDKTTNVGTGLAPYVNLLKNMIAPIRESKDWKAILCPYKAAVIEGVLPKWSHRFFCKRFTLSIPASCYSEWINKDKYTEEELEPYSEQFNRLKLDIANPE